VDGVAVPPGREAGWLGRWYRERVGSGLGRG